MLYLLDNTECRLGAFTLAIDKCELAQGKVYSVLGPNGSGKSTFLNLLALLSAPSKGTFKFRGADVDYNADLVSLRREIGYSMQSPYLFSMSVERNIGYGLEARGMGKSVVRKRVDSIMDRMSLSHLAGRSSRELSGGESQRVALARTLVLDTKVILLDEPTASVDASNVLTVEKTVLSLCEERNATLVFSTHSAEQAHRMSSNVFSIANGRVNGVSE